MASRLLAFVAVTTLTFGSNLEPLVGAARDGSVHHESAAAAAAHRSAAPGEHGHEHGPNQPRHHQHGPEHQHGTAGDHCTHAHGPALAAVAPLALGGAVVTLEFSPPVGHPTGHRRLHHPPPKA